MDGRKRLRAWIERSKITDRAAAKHIRIDHTQLSQILNGHRSPGLRTAVRIEEGTGIPVEAWMPTEGGRELTSVGAGSRKSKSGKA